MANNSLIGALHVALGIDTAQFSAGLKASQAGLAKFGKSVAVGFAAVSTAAVAAGAALGVAVKGAIDNADALSKAAQKAGVTTEALSRLKYAADYSDVSLEQLTGGLGRLSKTMLDVAGGSQGPAATAFKALGISVTDAAGNLRNSDAVFADIADRFSRMEDGATKTALAISLFGKAGAEMIPLLNSGKDGLAAMAAESDRLGLTLSTKTGKAAELFNDTLTKIGKIMEGVVNKVMEAALPALQALADELASPKFAAAAQQLAIDVVNAMGVITRAAEATLKSFQILRDGINPDQATLEQRYRRANGIADPNQSTNIEDRTVAGYSSGQDLAYLGNSMSFGDLSKFRVGGASASTKPFVPVIAGASAGKAAITDLMAGIDDAQPKVEDFAKSVSDDLAGAFTSMAKAALTGGDALGVLANSLLDIGASFLDSGLNQLFSGLFGGGLGGLFGGGGGFLSTGGGLATLGNVGSFAGGGYTGMGSRSGGLDGLGGFPAVLHPNETVVDHALGQSMGAKVVVNNFGSPDAVRTETRPDGTVELFVNEAVRRVEGNMAKGKYRPYGVTPGTRRT